MSCKVKQYKKLLKIDKKLSRTRKDPSKNKNGSKDLHQKYKQE